MENNIKVVHGDITKISVDAIVNAANTSLLGGGGVDGAIHRAGGKAILEDCQKVIRKQGKCKPGHAVVTTAGLLPSEYVIHTVGPRWNGGFSGEHDILEKCYISCFEIINSLNLKTIAFPSISTGTYGYPIVNAADVAINTVKIELIKNPSVESLVFVCFEYDVYQIYASKIFNSVPHPARS